MKRTTLSFIPGTVWLVITIILLVMPGSDVPSVPFFDLIYFDKWVHVGMFAILTFLWSFPFLKTELSSPKLFIGIALCSVLYGVLMEYVQKYFAFERDFDILDMLADAVGSMFALIWLLYLMNQKLFSKNKPL